MHLVRMSLLEGIWPFSVTAPTVKGLCSFQACQDVFLSLHPVLVRENDVKLF